MASEVLVGLGAIFTALAFGLTPAMTVFIGRMAFQKLEDEAATGFLRATFPVYHAMQAACAVLAALAFAMPRPIEAVVMGAVAFVGLFAWLYIMPIAHGLDDDRRAGKDVARELIRIQSRSSFIIVAQLTAMATVVIRVAIVPTPLAFG